MKGGAALDLTGWLGAGVDTPLRVEPAHARRHGDRRGPDQRPPPPGARAGDRVGRRRVRPHGAVAPAQQRVRRRVRHAGRGGAPAGRDRPGRANGVGRADTGSNMRARTVGEASRRDLPRRTRRRRAAAPRAQEIAVPVAVQIPILVKVLNFDRKLPERTGGRLVVGVLYQSGFRASANIADEVCRQIAELPPAHSARCQTIRSPASRSTSTRSPCWTPRCASGRSGALCEPAPRDAAARCRHREPRHAGDDRDRRPALRGVGARHRGRYEGRASRDRHQPRRLPGGRGRSHVASPQAGEGGGRQAGGR